MSLIDALTNHNEIKTRDCGDGITSYNFTTKAFVDNIWDATNVRARGLFLDENGIIVGRAYDKFFNVNQRPGFTYDEVIDTFTGPITVSEKLNGYLAIVFVAHGELKVFTKGGPGDFADEADRIVRKTFGDNLTSFTDMLSENNVSATFEIISDKDTHIIDEGAERAVLLDVIRNVDEYSPWTKDDTKAAGEKHCITVAQSYVISENELSATLDKAAATHNEGIVVMDSERRMTKVKSDYYLRVKALRGGLTRIWGGKQPRRINDDLKYLIDNGMDQETVFKYMVDNVNGPEVNLPALVKDYFPDW